MLYDNHRAITIKISYLREARKPEGRPLGKDIRLSTGSIPHPCDPA
jgi:hypothetical protein